MPRTVWAEIPSAIRHRIERSVGAEVREAQSQAGGFSAGVAVRVLLADGRRFFVKAVPSGATGTFELYLREAEVLRTIPRDLPAAHLVDAFTHDGWAVLVIEDVDGRHPQIVEADIRLVLDAIAELTAAPTSLDLPKLGDELAGEAGAWRRLEAAGLLDTTTPWCVAHIAELRDAAERVAVAVDGERLIHGDLRADNILIDASGRTRLLDWPWAAKGAGWEDALLYLLDVRVQDPTFDTDPLLQHPVFDGSRREDHVSLLAAIAGGWFETCRLPAPEGMTTLRDFQRREALAATEWLVRLCA